MFKSAIATPVTHGVKQVPLGRVLIIPYLQRVRVQHDLELDGLIAVVIPAADFEERKRVAVCIDVAAINKTIAQIALYPPSKIQRSQRP